MQIRNWRYGPEVQIFGWICIGVAFVFHLYLPNIPEIFIAVCCITAVVFGIYSFLDYMLLGGIAIIVLGLSGLYISGREMLKPPPQPIVQRVSVVPEQISKPFKTPVVDMELIQSIYADDLENAGPDEIDILLSVPLEERISKRPLIKFSHDGKYLSYLRNSQELVVRTLDNPLQETVFNTVNQIHSYDYSPVLNAVVYVDRKGQLHIVEDPKGRGNLPLPIEHEMFLESHIQWISTNKIQFTKTGEKLLTLDLDSLTFQTHEESSAFLLSTIKPHSKALIKPHSSVLGDIELNYPLGIESLDGAYSRNLFFNQARDIDFLFSPDLRHLVTVSNDRLHLHYLGVILKPHPVNVSGIYDIYTLSPKDRMTLADTMLSSKTFKVGIYAPLINPLNNTVVGPDLDRLKAVAVMDRWSTNEIIGSISVEKVKLRDGDIVGFNLNNHSDDQPGYNLYPDIWFPIQLMDEEVETPDLIRKDEFAETLLNNSRQERIDHLQKNIDSAFNLKDWGLVEDLAVETIQLDRGNIEAGKMLKELPFLRYQDLARNSAEANNWTLAKKYSGEALDLKPDDQELQEIHAEARFILHTKAAESLLSESKIKEAAIELSKALEAKDEYDRVRDLYQKIITELEKYPTYYGPLFQEISEIAPESIPLHIQLLENEDRVAVVEDHVISTFDVFTGERNEQYPLPSGRTFSQSYDERFLTSNRRFIVFPTVDQYNKNRMEVFDFEAEKFLDTPLNDAAVPGPVVVEISPDSNTLVYYKQGEEQLSLYQLNSNKPGMSISLKIIVPKTEENPLSQLEESKQLQTELIDLTFALNGNLVLLCRFKGSRYFISEIDLSGEKLLYSSDIFKADEPKSFKFDSVNQRLFLRYDDGYKLFSKHRNRYRETEEEFEYLSDQNHISVLYKKDVFKGSNSSSGNTIFDIQCGSGVSQVDLFENQKRLAVIYDEGTVRIWGYRN